MLKQLWIISIFVAVAMATSVPMMQCPKNEEYKDCAIGVCINTCANPQKSLTCKGACFPGCGCIKDYLRNSKGVCVPPEKCDGCPRHEMLVVRLGKITCENTCADPDLGTRCTALISGPTCRCKPGYLRNSKGKCVRPVKCGQELPIQYQKKCPKTGEPVCLCDLNKEQKTVPTPDTTGEKLTNQYQQKCPKTGELICLCDSNKEPEIEPTPKATGKELPVKRSIQYQKMCPITGDPTCLCDSNKKQNIAPKPPGVKIPILNQKMCPKTGDPNCLCDSNKQKIAPTPAGTKMPILYQKTCPKTGDPNCLCDSNKQKIAPIPSGKKLPIMDRKKCPKTGEPMCLCS